MTTEPKPTSESEPLREVVVHSLDELRIASDDPSIGKIIYEVPVSERNKKIMREGPSPILTIDLTKPIKVSRGFLFQGLTLQVDHIHASLDEVEQGGDMLVSSPRYQSALKAATDELEGYRRLFEAAPRLLKFAKDSVIREEFEDKAGTPHAMRPPTYYNDVLELRDLIAKIEGKE